MGNIASRRLKKIQIKMKHVYEYLYLYSETLKPTIIQNEKLLVGRKLRFYYFFSYAILNKGPLFAGSSKNNYLPPSTLSFHAELPFNPHLTCTIPTPRTHCTTAFARRSYHVAAQRLSQIFFFKNTKHKYYSLKLSGGCF